MHLSPYLSFDGNCAQAFQYYKEHLGATGLVLIPFRGSPGEQMATPEWRDKIMHGSLNLGNDKLMGSDGMAGQDRQGMHGCALSLSVETVDQAERAFGALADGGRVDMPLDTTFFASKFGMVTDRFGVAWMVVCESPC